MTKWMKTRQSANFAWTCVRYGKWECGCEFYKGKPMFGVHSTWYDGQWVSAHFGPLWVSVHYCGRTTHERSDKKAAQYINPRSKT